MLKFVLRSVKASRRTRHVRRADGHLSQFIITHVSRRRPSQVIEFLEVQYRLLFESRRQNWRNRPVVLP
jgi:hypothetical protein